MDFDAALKYLENQFSGAMVLYVGDIAKILGRSKKATSHLASRNELPFKIKKVGGLRCVDIFQVAQWFASNAEVAQEATQEPQAALSLKAKAKGTLMTPVAPKQGRKPAQVKNVDELDESAFGFMALNILKERKAQQLSMQRFVHALSDPTERAFMSEVLEKMFFSEDLLPTSYAVTLKKLAPQYFKVRAEVRTKYFESKEHALDYLVTKLVKARYCMGNCITHLTLEQSGKTLFHAVSSELDRLLVESNDVGLELLGL
jgi:hypothetical protein